MKAENLSRIDANLVGFSKIFNFKIAFYILLVNIFKKKSKEYLYMP